MRTSIKKTIAFALTLCAISAGTIAPNAGKFALSPTPIVASAEKVGDYVYTRRSVGSATLTSYKGSASSITLPTSVVINGQTYTVSGIDTGAFEYNKNLRSVNIPYGYSNIGTRAFRGCSNLTSVSIASTVISIRSSAFQETGLTSVTLPSALKSMEAQVFNRCTSLKSVTMPANNLKTIPNDAFSSCPNLTSVSLPSNIRTIGSGAFQNCTSLKSFTIPSGVTTLGNYAFADCSKLSSISIPSSVTDFGVQVFLNTPWLKNHSKSNLLVIHNSVVIDGSSATRNVSIPSGTKGIAGGAFSGNRYIQQVTIPSSVTYIGESAFSGCSNLATVNMQKGLKTIQTGAFNSCYSIRSISVPDSVETIGNSVFSGCSYLTKFRFPSNLKTIGNGAFYGCSSLSEITNVNTGYNYSIASDAFETATALKKINGQYFVSRNSDGSIRFYNEAFTRKYFSKGEKIGFLQDYLDYICTYVVNKVKNANPKYTQAQTAAALEDWICSQGCSPKEYWYQTYGNKNYPQGLENRPEYHNELSVLFNGVGVCEGWAKGYNLLLRKAGITSEIVGGINTSGGENHAWNVVKMDEVWFNIDAYWDDNGSKSKRSLFLVSSQELKDYEIKNNTSRCHNQQYVMRRENNYGQINKIYTCDTALGDVNLDGKIDSSDANAVTYYYKNNGYISGTFNKTCADINIDGVIDSKDVQSIWSKISKK